MRCAQARAAAATIQSRFKEFYCGVCGCVAAASKAKSTKLYLKVNSPCVTERAGATHAKPRQITNACNFQFRVEEETIVGRLRVPSWAGARPRSDT